MFFKYLSFKVFIVSLSIGLLFTYLSAPTPTVIYVYPTPENVGKIDYVDKTGNCFNLKETQVNCPTDKSKIHKIPAQQ